MNTLTARLNKITLTQIQLMKCLEDEKSLHITDYLSTVETKQSMCHCLNFKVCQCGISHKENKLTVNVCLECEYWLGNEHFCNNCERHVRVVRRCLLCGCYLCHCS